MYNNQIKQPQQNNPQQILTPSINNEQQLSFIKYIERKNYFFPLSSQKNNPLMPLYSLKKSDMILPKSNTTNPENDICIKLSFFINNNKFDKKPINCVKFFCESNKIVYGTTSGWLTVHDVNSAFDTKVYYSFTI